MSAKKFRFVYAVTFILAFCSIIYELVLAQALSAFLENTVLRYSVTIGLYMFSMGFGALLCEGKFVKHPVVTLLVVEIMLTLMGGFALIYLHLLDYAGLSRWAFSAAAHALIIGIGVLTGFEIPLLLSMKEESAENAVIAVNYLGAFAGTVGFAFFFYPQAGLMATTFFVGLLNTIAGLLLYSEREGILPAQRPLFRMLSIVLGCLALVLFVCLIQAGPINEYFMNLYLGIS